MQLVDLIGTGSRVIEINAADGSLGSRLLATGCGNYLAIAANEARRSIIARQHPSLVQSVVSAASKRVVRQNNADTLILSGWSSLNVMAYRSFRHAQYVAFPLELTPQCAMATQLAAMQVLLRRLELPCVVAIDAIDRGPQLLIYRVRRRHKQACARQYIPNALGVEGFLHRLRSMGLRHSVLRWFEELPRLAAGEDIDLLVDDADLANVQSLLEMGPGVQPIDLYTVTGLPGTDYRKMPYYPPYLAEELLSNSTDLRGLCQVPSPREHFLSLAYHVLYHKGYLSGLCRRGESKPRCAGKEHDYTQILRDLAGRIGVDVPVTLEDLDEYLDSQGWRPPQDMLVRLAKRNPWIRTLLRSESNERYDHGLAVFLIREEALRRGGVNRAADWLAKQGFSILAVENFDQKLADLIARSTRGGNWGQGPWKHSGGKPVAAVVVYDPNPVRPTRRETKKQPQVMNSRLFCKDGLRDYFNEGYPVEQHCNIVHSSDNGREAMDYLRIIMPEKIQRIMAEIESTKSPRLMKAA